MNPTTGLSKKKDGQQLTNVERHVIISKLVDLLCEGYTSTNSLALKLGIARATVETYRPIADELIGKMKLDRNVIRNLQVRRTYELIEKLMDELKAADTPKDKALFYNQIFKFSSHLALITGLNIETHVHADPSKLVIIRAARKEAKEPIDQLPDTVEAS